MATTSTAAGLRRILTDRFDWVTDVDTGIDTSETPVTGTGGWVPRTEP